MGAQPPEPERGSEEMRDGNRGNRKLRRGSHREERGEHTPNPKPNDGSNRPSRYRCHKNNQLKDHVPPSPARSHQPSSYQHEAGSLPFAFSVVGTFSTSVA
jgi:hypothetical protein